MQNQTIHGRSFLYLHCPSGLKNFYNMLDISLSTDHDWNSIAALEFEWNQLISECPNTHIFNTWEWANCWSKTNHSKYKLHLITARSQDGKLVAIAPFYIETFYLFLLIPIRTLRVLGDQSSGADYPAIICPSEKQIDVCEALLSYLLNNKRDWDTLWSPNIAAWEDNSKNFKK